VQAVTTAAIPKSERMSSLDLSALLPRELLELGDLQTAIPRIAKDPVLSRLIRETVERIPTRHTLVHGDARRMSDALVGKAHLVLTSPPYWTLKQYRDTAGQMGHITDYDEFLVELDRVWQRCFDLLVGSFGNNYNNRTEEAIGSATDIWTAYREGAFKPSAKPWLGYLMLLEDASGSTRPVKAQEPHFKVFEEFKLASYARRYEILLTKLVRERLYDATCFLMSNSTDRLTGHYKEPVQELNFTNFISSLLAKAIARKKTQ
jgi:restriction endonuclease XhoI-like protein